MIGRTKHLYQAREQGFLGFPLLPSYLQGAALRERLGNLRVLPQRGRKTETAKAGLRPHQAPPGIGAVQTFSGRHITIGEDRIVEMSEEDANCLIPVGWTLLTEPACDA